MIGKAKTRHKTYVAFKWERNGEFKNFPIMPLETSVDISCASCNKCLSHHGKYQDPTRLNRFKIICPGDVILLDENKRDKWWVVTALDFEKHYEWIKND